MTISEIAAKSQVHPNQVTTWKRQAVEGMADVFAVEANRGTDGSGGQGISRQDWEADRRESFFSARAQEVSPAKKKVMIRRDHPDLSISQQCKLVKLSRSTFYYMPVEVSTATLELMKAIDRAFTKYPFSGSRQITAHLRRDGIVVGRYRVRRLMAKMGLEAIYRRPRTSQPQPQHTVYPYLLRCMTINRPNQILLSAM